LEISCRNVGSDSGNCVDWIFSTVVTKPDIQHSAFFHPFLLRYSSDYKAHNKGNKLINVDTPLPFRLFCHCEERSDEAISPPRFNLFPPTTLLR